VAKLSHPLLVKSQMYWTTDYVGNVKENISKESLGSMGFF